MLRETRARWLALVTGVMVVALAALFAWLRNLPGEAAPAPPAAPAVVDSVQLAAGRAAFERLNCAMCHSIGGRGNRSYPLDGIGSRRDAAALRDWALAEGSARGQLPAGIASIKARAAADPDVPALIEYLASLK